MIGLVALLAGAACRSRNLWCLVSVGSARGWLGVSSWSMWWLFFGVAAYCPRHCPALSSISAFPTASVRLMFRHAVEMTAERSTGPSPRP